MALLEAISIHERRLEGRGAPSRTFALEYWCHVTAHIGLVTSVTCRFGTLNIRTILRSMACASTPLYFFSQSGFRSSSPLLASKYPRRRSRSSRPNSAIKGIHCFLERFRGHLE